MADVEQCGHCGEPVNTGFTVCRACGANKRRDFSASGWVLILLALGSCAIGMGGTTSESRTGGNALAWIFLIAAFIVGRKSQWFRRNA